MNYLRPKGRGNYIFSRRYSYLWTRCYEIYAFHRMIFLLLNWCPSKYLISVFRSLEFFCMY